VAGQYVFQAISTWARLGLLEGAAAPTEPPLTNDAPERAEADVTSPSAQRPPTGLLATCIFDLLETRFELHFGSRRLFDLVAPTIQHLRTDGAGTRRISVRIYESADNFILESDRGELARCSDPMEVAPMTLGQLILVAIRSSTNLYAIHASAVRRDGHTFLFIGATGAGKSTLAAALAAVGFEHLADDTVSLDDRGLRIRPVPAPPCLKAGAWELLRKYYPDIGRLPTHRRADGRALRYLEGVPRPAEWNGHSRNCVLTLVFVTYDPTGATQVRPLTCTEALARLFGHLYVLPDRLEPSDVDALLAWVKTARCLSLSSASLEYSINAVRELCP
jgi:hypothetical protein